MVFRRLYRLGTRLGMAHAAACGLFVGMAAAAHDRVLEQRWRISTHAAQKSDGVFSKVRALNQEEKECLEAWMDLMRFRVDPTGSLKRFSTKCTLNDTLIFFDGLSELTDGFTFMSFFYDYTTPSVTELRREESKNGVWLHAKMTTEAKVRFLPITYTFPSAVSLELEDWGGAHNQITGISLSTKKRIKVAEHRWFGGPIVSRFTGTYKNSYGDLGDLIRRLNGFTLATAVTNSEHLLAA